MNDSPMDVEQRLISLTEAVKQQVALQRNIQKQIGLLQEYAEATGTASFMMFQMLLSKLPDQRAEIAREISEGLKSIDISNELCVALLRAFEETACNPSQISQKRQPVLLRLVWPPNSDETPPQAPQDHA